MHRQCGGHGFESRWSPDFFQASSFQLLKLENLLRWSFFTFSQSLNTIICCDTTHFDSEDDYRTGCQNVSHCQQQQSYSGLRSPRRSYSTYVWHDSLVQTFYRHELTCLFNSYHWISHNITFPVIVWKRSPCNSTLSCKEIHCNITVYLPTFSESNVWGFRLASTRISEHFRWFSEDFQTLLKMSEDAPITFEHFWSYFKGAILVCCDKIERHFG